MAVYREAGKTWQPKQVFVFGSNQGGRHGRGAARFAALNCGAIYGQGSGMQGSSYAIPTKDDRLQTLALYTISNNVKAFLHYASLHPEVGFFVTAVGTGEAGIPHETMAAMFKDAPDNCLLPAEWADSSAEEGK